jgi:hypothetical protein
MSKNYELIQKVVKDGKYQVLEDDGEHIVIKYQLNSIHICPSSEEDRFVSILLPNFADVTEENFPDVIMRCHKLNETMKQVKLYTINDVLIAGVEFFYMEEEDLAYQVKIALNNVLAAKVNYRKLDR